MSISFCIIPTRVPFRLLHKFFLVYFPGSSSSDELRIEVTEDYRSVVQSCQVEVFSLDSWQAFRLKYKTPSQMSASQDPSDDEYSITMVPLGESLASYLIALQEGDFTSLAAVDELLYAIAVACAKNGKKDEYDAPCIVEPFMRRADGAHTVVLVCVVYCHTFPVLQTVTYKPLVMRG